jgi:hypothetical protein
MPLTKSEEKKLKTLKAKAQKVKKDATKLVNEVTKELKAQMKKS